MKRLLAIAGVVLFFLLLIGLLILKLFLPGTKPNTAAITPTQFPTVTESTGSTAQSPTEFVRSFYSWYLLNFSRDPYFPHPENRNQVLAPWITSQFLGSWDATQSDLEVNPVLLTADDPAAWGAGISTQLSSQSIRSAVVYTTIGQGAQMHAYNVELVQDPTDGTWKINMVSSTI